MQQETDAYAKGAKDYRDTITTIVKLHYEEKKQEILSGLDSEIAVEKAELKKALDRHDELTRDYNNGEPEKQGSESRNYQKYLDRVAEMKAAIARNESDIEGIRRELSRLPPSNR